MIIENITLLSIWILRRWYFLRVYVVFLIRKISILIWRINLKHFAFILILILAIIVYNLFAFNYFIIIIRLSKSALWKNIAFIILFIEVLIVEFVIIFVNFLLLRKELVVLIQIIFTFIDFVLAGLQLVVVLVYLRQKSFIINIWLRILFLEIIICIIENW